MVTVLRAIDKKAYPFHLDETAEMIDQMAVSAGCTVRSPAESTPGLWMTGFWVPLHETFAQLHYYGEAHMRENLNVYAVGDFGQRDKWNPDFLISSLGAWPLLAVLATGPSTAAALADRCQLSVGKVESTLSSLEELGIVKFSGQTFTLGFAWFSATDQDVIQESVREVAQELAAEVLGQKDEIDEQLRTVRAFQWIDLRDLRFAVVGCFGLDWGGLDGLKASGYLEHDKAQPGGRRYVMYVEEPVDHYNQKDYTGSHTTWAGDAYQWTSFGDHSGRRFGLPDLVWHAAGAVARSERLPEEIRIPLVDLTLEAFVGQMETAAQALVRIARGNESKAGHHPLLFAARAVGAQRPTVPVFWWNEDGEAISRVVEIVKEKVLSVVSDRYRSLQGNLAGLAALRNGVPFAECFNPIWHVLFGRTNRMLAEDGFLADPVPRIGGEGRYRWWLTVRA